MLTQPNPKHKSAILAKAVIHKVPFNPEDERHLRSLKTFLDTGKWGDVRFVAELPHVEVPMTCLVKLARHVLRDVQLEPSN
jgi:hypothetical protein